MQHNDADALAGQMAARCLGSRVGRLHRLIGRRFDQALAPFGLTMPQLEILAALTSVREPVSPSMVAGVLAVERSTMSRNLALLEGRGWVAVADRSPAGRAMTFTVTEAGVERLTAAADAWVAAQREAEVALGSDAPGAIDGWLDALAGVAGDAADGVASDAVGGR